MNLSLGVSFGPLFEGGGTALDEKQAGWLTHIGLGLERADFSLGPAGADEQTILPIAAAGLGDLLAEGLVQTREPFAGLFGDTPAHDQDVAGL